MKNIIGYKYQERNKSRTIDVVNGFRSNTTPNKQWEKDNIIRVGDKCRIESSIYAHHDGSVVEIIGKSSEHVGYFRVKLNYMPDFYIHKSYLKKIIKRKLTPEAIKFIKEVDPYGEDDWDE